MVTKDTQFALQLISIKWLEEIEEGCASRRIIIYQSNKFTFFSYQNSIPGEAYDWLNEWIQSVGHPSENNDMSNPPSPNLLLLLLFLRVFRTFILLVNCVVGRPDLTLCFTPNHPQMNTTRIYAARSTTHYQERKGEGTEAEGYIHWTNIQLLSPFYIRGILWECAKRMYCYEQRQLHRQGVSLRGERKHTWL